MLLIQINPVFINLYVNKSQQKQSKQELALVQLVLNKLFLSEINKTKEIH